MYSEMEKESTMNLGLGEATSTEYKYKFIVQAVVLVISYLLFLGFLQVYKFRPQECNN